MNQPLTSDNGQARIQQPDLARLFSQLDPQEVEQFYQFYHVWQQQGHVQQLVNEIETLRWHIAENDVLLQQAQPSTMVQADIALLETRGIVDIDLLDRMVGRGEIWLNRTIDLLQRCEELNMIGETYEAWCEHALEGAYEWISTMDENTDEPIESSDQQQGEEGQENADISADAFIRKLMSEEIEPSMLTDESVAAQDATDTVATAQETGAPESATALTPELSDTTGPTNQHDQTPEETQASARLSEDEGIGDIEVQSPADLETEAQQAADFEQNPAADESSASVTTASNPNDSIEQADAENSGVDTSEKDDRQWPYILDTEETVGEEDQSSSPEQQMTQTEAENAQAQQENAHSQQSSQEPQSLVHKLLTRVLRW